MNLDNLRDAVQNISLYDVKAAVRKAQNGELFPPPFWHFWGALSPQELFRLYPIAYSYLRQSS